MMISLNMVLSLICRIHMFGIILITLIVLLFTELTSARSNISMAEFVEGILNRKGYRSNTRPGLDLDTPTSVTLNIFVNSISSIDDFNMEYSITFYLRQKWLDPRLAFTELNKTVTLNYNDISRIWVPDLFFRNEKAGMLHDITVPNRLIRLWPNGTLLFSQRLSLRLDCTLELHNFPFDEQTCNMEIGSYGYTTDDLVFIWEKYNALKIKEHLELPEFAVKNSSVGDCAKNFSTGVFACVFAEFHFTRKFEYYLLQTYIPSLMVVVLSWVSFWIDIEAVPARISLGLLTVLTMTTQASTISARLPRVSYIKGIDVWMTACLLFVFGALIEYSAVNVLYRKKSNTSSSSNGWNMDEPNELDDLYEDGEKQLAKLAMNANATQGNACTVRRQQSHQNCFKKMCENKAICIDVSSRFIFPGSFLLFNVVYWLLYGILLQ